MAYSRFYSFRQIARNSTLFCAPVHITTNDLYPAPLEDTPTIHGMVDVVGRDYLHLTQIGDNDGTRLSVAWGAIAGIEFSPSEGTRNPRCHTRPRFA